MEIEKEIIDYYNKGVEVGRLFFGMYQLEKVRTQDIIQRYLTKVPSKVLDIGGGTGFYSFWLNDLGHEVYLLDPTVVNIEKAKSISRESQKRLASILIGEARELKFEEGYFDVVLSLGPQYHLTKKEERLKALAEANRVLSKGGLLFSVSISRYASMLDGFFHNLVADTDFIKILNQDLKDGQHRNPKHLPEYFTTAYFHHPDEFKDEIALAGFKLVALIGITGYGWLLPDFDKKWQNQEYRELLLRTLQKVESDEYILGMSSHIMAVARKT